MVAAFCFSYYKNETFKKFLKIIIKEYKNKVNYENIYDIIKYLYDIVRYLKIIIIEEGRIKWPVTKWHLSFFSLYRDPVTQDLKETVPAYVVGIVYDFKAEGSIFLALNSFYCFFVS